MTFPQAATCYTPASISKAQQHLALLHQEKAHMLWLPQAEEQLSCDLMDLVGLWMEEVLDVIPIGVGHRA